MKKIKSWMVIAALIVVVLVVFIAVVFCISVSVSGVLYTYKNRFNSCFVLSFMVVITSCVLLSIIAA